jgi:transmembrane sensor
MAEVMWERLGRKIDGGWGPERDRAARLAIERRLARRRAAMRLGGAMVAVALVAGGWIAARGHRAHVPPAPAAMASAGPASTTGDAVAITQLSPETNLEPMPDRRGRGFVLRSGGARFLVSHDPERPFVVVAGDVLIEDLGTTFTVRYLSDAKVDVAVEEGRVRVHARGGVADLAAGDEQDFAVSSLAPEPEPEPAPRRPGNETATPSWRLLAESGRYDEAHAALKRAGPNAVRDETADLLLAADAARLSGHPAAAVPYLERVVHRHGSDPRAGLAWFTLGRVLLEELGRPREAADAFARAREAGGPLAEDALAREVEATARAGDTVRSRELAREYQALYPNGRRAKAVSRWGGLD